jgi:prepilin-type processing-associated H-X9-DG protein/prepilin-type N-terminal cleavage/methylation domain-containing protein
MKRSKGFTLAELLTVIMVIALLAAILIPALGAVNKEAAYRAGCANRLKAFLVANTMYANQNNQSYVPVRYVDPNGRRLGWLSNQAFRDAMNLDAYAKTEDRSVGGSILLYDLPNAFLCPSDKISPFKMNRYFRDGANVLLSYAYNYTDWERSNWDSWSGYPADAGHKADKIPLPSEKLAFTDSVDWWIVWRSADYRIGWDKLGQANIVAYKSITPRVDGPVLYRHNEGANVGFYDGHVKYMKKEQAFVKEDRDANPRKPGMWVADMAAYFSNDVRGRGR